MDASSVMLAVAVVLAAAAAGKALALLLDWARIARGLNATAMPVAPGALPLLGHTLKLLAGTPWDIFVSWLIASGDSCVRFRVLNKVRRRRVPGWSLGSTTAVSSGSDQPHRPARRCQPPLPSWQAALAALPSRELSAS